MSLPTDTRFGNQWYLHNTSVGGYDLNVAAAWDDYSGEGVDVTVIDDGFDYLHSDLAPNYRTDRDYDFGADDADAAPVAADDNHGTAIMGILGAARNGTGVVGVAYGAELTGFRSDLSSGATREAIDATANTAAAHYVAADIVSMSFGATSTFVAAADYAAMVDDFALGSAVGRDGLGTVYVKSAGNDRGVDDTNAEMRDATPFTVTVAATLENGSIASYSTPGASVLVAAIGSDGTVETTDRVGAPGYTGSDFVWVAGTSAATPMVSGIVALMLEANPDLGWRDVQTILAYSSRHVGSDVGAAATGAEQFSGARGTSASWLWNGAENWNGGGLHFSNDYGFGLVDATAAVRLAETWTQQSTSANRVQTTLDLLGSAVTIAASGSSTFSGTETENVLIEHVTLDVNFLALDDKDDLEIFLTSPGGTTSKLIADIGGADSFTGRWSFGSNAFRGEYSAGTWSVTVHDDDGAGAIRIDDLDILTFGAAPSADEIFVFTDEYAAFAGTGGHTTAVGGGSGYDVLNAAAVGSAIAVNLATGNANIAGVATTVSGIEAVFAGDGDDELTGGGAGEALHGGRGADRLDGGGGDDILEGGPGADKLIGRSGIDTADYASSRAAVTISLATGNTLGGDAAGDAFASIENLAGSAFADFLKGDGGANLLTGRAGDDRLDGDGGDDILAGGSGADMLNGDAGFDMADYSASAAAVTVSLVTGNALGGDAVGDTFSGVEDLRGSAFADFLKGDSGANRLVGGSGGDRLEGYWGDDVLVGGAGGDVLRGDAGSDTADYADSAAKVTISLLTGNALGGDAAGDSLDSIENLTGSAFGDFLKGDTGANRLAGGGGADRLEGHDGDDVLAGGAGGDLLRGDAGIDTADYAGSASAVTISLLTGNAIGGDAAGDSFFSIEDLGGSAFDDFLKGDAGANRLAGRAGADRLEGGTGDDVLEGGSGADRLDGGGGSDMADYSTSRAAVTISLMTGNAVGGDAEGDVFAGIEGLSGSAYDDYLKGDGGANRLEGAAGDDRLEGGGGADRLSGGSGIDTADYGGSAAGVTISLASGNTAGGDAAGDSFAGIENLVGSVHADFLKGDSGANRLDGAEGDDRLDGYTGDDVLRGGAGADTLNGQSGNDTADYAGSAGAVAINLRTGGASGGDAAGDTLSSIENLIGTAQDDTLIGSAAANRLEGGDGNDTLEGGAGGDVLIGGAGIDTAEYDASAAGVTISLATGNTAGGEAAGDRLIDIENLTGSSHDDFLKGDDGANRLKGGGGADRIEGGAGDDSLQGGDGSDIFVFGNNEGSDTVLDFSAGAGSVDVIDLGGNSFLRSFADVMANAADESLGVAIDLGNASRLTLLGVDRADLHQDDFAF